MGQHLREVLDDLRASDTPQGLETRAGGLHAARGQRVVEDRERAVVGRGDAG